VIIGKQVDTAVGSLVRQSAPGAEVIAINQPNAFGPHITSKTTFEDRRAVFELCSRYRSEAATSPESNDFGRQPVRRQIPLPAGSIGRNEQPAMIVSRRTGRSTYHPAAQEVAAERERDRFTHTPFESVGELYRGRTNMTKMVEPAMLINIAQEYRPDLTPEQLYERTRRYWVCSPEKRTRKPRLALSVAGGVIHEVYRIDSWESYPVGETIHPDADRVKNQPFVPQKTRAGFFGAISPAHARYRGVSVAHLQRPGAQNPIMYLNLDRVDRRAG
jgi:hypothetical protein